MKVTVNNQDKKEVIDWNKVQLVVNEGENVIMVSSKQKPYDEDCFCGQSLIDGRYYNSWRKSSFCIYNKSITLQND